MLAASEVHMSNKERSKPEEELVTVAPGVLSDEAEDRSSSKGEEAPADMESGDEEPEEDSSENG
jgi:hypothetical protein